jgi:hypothetical protein
MSSHVTRCAAYSSMDAAEHGLPGEHHFYITFLSKAEGVKLSPRLLSQYPQEMTVILQHQFWDLVVTDDRFEVGLSFNGIPERLVIPFSAIKSSSIRQFSSVCSSEPVDTPAAETETPVETLPPAAVAETPAETDEPVKQGEGAEVVRLDRFRKK